MRESVFATWTDSVKTRAPATTSFPQSSKRRDQVAWAAHEFFERNHVTFRVTVKLGESLACPGIVRAACLVPGQNLLPGQNIVWSLKNAKRAIIAGGCLAAAYTQLTTSPATIQYIRSIGANEFHIGILCALPTFMLFMQFVSAIVVNHLKFRRKLWFWTSFSHRLLLLPTALGPWIFSDLPDLFWVWMLIGTTALNQGLLHFSSPLWLSWMGDYLPHKSLSAFWGQRQVWMQTTAALSLCVAAFLIHRAGLPIAVSYSIMICIGTLCGVIDLLLFRKVDEPRVRQAVSPRLHRVFAEPFRNREFRRYIGFMCFWNFAAMAGTPFISLYLLADIGMDLYHVMLLWTISWVGGAMLSRTWGRWADSHGTQPVLVMCVALKSTNMLALLLVPPVPTIAFWVLVPCFMLDAILNAGILIANNGFMIKNSPTENRTMYIAATQAVAGMVGGLTSIFAGWAMKQMAGHHWTIAGWTMGQFQILFLVSIVLRWMALAMTRFVHEPNARHTWDVVQEVVSDMLGRWEIRQSLSGKSDPEINALKTSDEAKQVDEGSQVPRPHNISPSRLLRAKRVRKSQRT